MDTTAKIKIFLVDDDAMFAESLKHTLSQETTDIKTFSNGEECLKNLKKEEPGIVVLDYYLSNDSRGGLNGVQILNKIKQTSPDTEVIMLSAQDNIAVAMDTLKYGAYDYISKGPSAYVRIKNDIKHICDAIGQADNLNKKAKRIKMINLLIVILVILAFILSKIL